MGRYAARRIVEAIPALLGVSLISFLLLHIVPGNVARIMLGDKYTFARARALDHSLGLDKPLWQQYLIWLNNLLHANMGYSYAYHIPVWTLIMENLPHTLTLVLVSIMVAHLFALCLGTVQAYYHDGWFDRVVTIITYFLYAMPTFWLGILLVQWFAIDLGWFPSGGISNPLVATPSFGDIVYHLVLPCTALIVTSLAGWARYMRSSMMETLLQDFVRTARAKGLGEPRVVFVHALRNSVLPLITLFGLSLPGLFAGALFIEEIFNYPGMGLLYWNAVNDRDFPIILGVTMFLGALTVLGNLIADLLYALVDPRIQYN
jgi:peptide/nickel transport system permease protein